MLRRLFGNSRRGRVQVGDISQSQGVNFGDGATVTVSGSTIRVGTAEAIDATALKAALVELYGALDSADLPADALRTVRTSTDNAISQGIDNGRVKGDALVAHLQAAGKVVKEANVVASEGSPLWESVRKLAPLVGPLVGGARVVAAWFGVPLP